MRAKSVSPSDPLHKKMGVAEEKKALENFAPVLLPKSTSPLTDDSWLDSPSPLARPPTPEEHKDWTPSPDRYSPFDDKVIYFKESRASVVAWPDTHYGLYRLWIARVLSLIHI